jgi:hypothetical protein
MHMAVEVKLYLENKSGKEAFRGLFSFAVAPSPGERVEIAEANDIWVYEIVSITHHPVPLPKVSTTQTWQPTIDATIRFVTTFEV